VIIGTIETVGATPQAALNTAFPSAVAGDGVQDQATTDFWVYNGTTWVNVGPNPGLVTTPTAVILPYNETAIYDARLRVTAEVTSYNFSLQLLTTIPPLVLRSRVEVFDVVLLAANTGGLILTGQGAVLVRRYSLVSAAASFALAGFSAGSLRSYIIGLGSGTFSSAGDAANLLITRALVDIQAGAFDLTGQEALLGVLVAISADSGELIADGQPANLSKNSILEPSVSTYNISGQDAILAVDSLLVADGNSFTLLGQDAVLVTVIKMPADPGSFALAGEETGGTIVRRLISEVGSYSLAGQNISLEVGDYFSSWSSQTYGYQSLVYPDWWAD
jgi:hypothetical protein